MDAKRVVWHKTILLPGSLEDHAIDKILGAVITVTRDLAVNVSKIHRSENGGKPGIRITCEDLTHANAAIPKAYQRITPHLDEVHQELEVVTHVGSQRC